MTSIDISARNAKPFHEIYESRWLQGYVRSKIATDPVYRGVWNRVGSRNNPLLDLGCGVGVLAFYLRERGWLAPITGIDTDLPKIEAARSVAVGRYEGLHFEVGNALDSLRGFRGDVVMLDLLHYLADDDQDLLIRRATEAAAGGGMILIRDCLREPGWRFALTSLEERFARAIRWLNVPMLNFPSRDRIVGTLQACGFKVEVEPMWGRTPFNNYLITATSAPGQAVAAKSSDHQNDVMA